MVENAQLHNISQMLQQVLAQINNVNGRLDSLHNRLTSIECRLPKAATPQQPPPAPTVPIPDPMSFDQIRDQFGEDQVKVEPGMVPEPAKMPSEVRDKPWIFVNGPEEYAAEHTYGKWLFFENTQNVDKTWSEVSLAVQNGSLHSSGAKVATMMQSAYADYEKVICVYTSEHRVDEVGRLLLELLPCVRKHQTIRYKTDDATMRGEYYNARPKAKAKVDEDGDPNEEDYDWWDHVERTERNKRKKTRVTCRQAVWNNGKITFRK